MRIACLQFNPTLGQVKQNITRVNKIIETTLQKLSKPFDILVLPELALTGYNFQSQSEIESYLEPAGDGISTKWAIETSKKYKCFTLVGYPERCDQKIYNSAVLVSPSGSIIHNYRKTHLYEADEHWGCSENPNKEFESFKIYNKNYYLKNEPPTYLITTQVGICMDLNPYKFEAPFSLFEFSLSCFRNKSKLILCPMAWLSPESPSISESVNANPIFKQSSTVKYDINLDARVTTDGDKIEKNNSLSTVAELPEQSTIDYWLLRFLPFIQHPNVTPYFKDMYYYKKVSLVCCNRSGQEGDVLYGGSSLIFQFLNSSTDPGFSLSDLSNKTGTGNPSIHTFGSLNQGQEGIIVRDIDVEID